MPETERRTPADLVTQWQQDADAREATIRWYDSACSVLDKCADELEAALRQAEPPLPTGARYLVFSCPSCGDPAASTVEPEVDIHSGATYRCDRCQARVVFSAEPPTGETVYGRGATGEDRGDDVTN